MNEFVIDMRERNLRWNSVRQNRDVLVHSMRGGTGERWNARRPFRWVHPEREDSTMVLRGATHGEGRRGQGPTGQMWGVPSTQEEDRRGLPQGVDTGDGQRQASILRFPQGPVSNTRVDENRRRYYQQEGDGVEDSWVRVEPRRKKADRTTRPVKQME